MKNTLFNKVIAALNNCYNKENAAYAAQFSLREELIAAFAESEMTHLVFREALLAKLASLATSKWEYNTKYALRVLVAIDDKFRLRSERSDKGTKANPIDKLIAQAVALKGKERAKLLAALVASK